MSKYEIEEAPYIEYTPVYTTYMGNPDIKPPGTKIEYTAEMLTEWVKCYNDPLYFISNYYYIVTLDGGLEKIKLWDFQKDFIMHMHDNRFTITLASRQVGKSIISIGYIIWYLIFHEHKYVAILSKSAPDASAVVKKLKKSFTQIPQWLQPNVTGWAKTSVSFDNGSEVTSQATTANAGRSASANILFLDEFAFVPTNIASQFYTSAYPIISNSKESKVIICSTPNGHNHFYVMQDKAEKGENDFKKFVIMWTQVPGRDEAWKQMTIRNIAMEEGGDGEAKFAQEYDLEFENTSTKVLIGAAVQRRISNHISNNSHEVRIDAFDDIKELKIYEMPIIDSQITYFIPADVSYGVGSDYSAFSVIKVQESGYKQVARFKDNYINPVAFAEMVERFSQFYNNAGILIENNGPGQSSVDHLWYNIETDNMIHTDKKMLGVRTHQKLRNKGITNLKEYLDFGILELNDLESLQEVSHFGQNVRKKFEAQEGFHDDLVIGLVIFSYFTKDPGFSSYLNIDFKGDDIKNKIKNKVEEDNPYIFNYENINNPDVITLVDNSAYFR